MLIEVELYQIVITDGLETQVIVLKEKLGERQLPIFIGVNEARAIERKLKDVPVPRPLTHDLAIDLIQKLGGEVRRVVINDLRQETYFAMLEIKQDGSVIEVDARPSDAVALAVRSAVPIYVEEFVIDHTNKSTDIPKL
ncbi:MAG TPA: bifunctional nuclease family protein [Planctomycetota bacterium]|nr:bifunctional nuclease family protein [Planctomycetota bacterium]